MGRYLVTGGAGFIGSHVAEALLGRGDEVLVLDNLDRFYPLALKRQNLAGLMTRTGFRFVEGDIRDGALVGRLDAEFAPEVVLHLAAKAGVRPSVEHPLEYLDVNVGGTVQLLHACPSVRRLVFASSSSVYGATNRVPFSEEQAVGRPLSPYAASKLSAEAFCHAHHHLRGLPMVILRFFTVYGPRQRPDLAINKFVRLVSSGQPVPVYGDGHSERDYTFVEDAVRAVLAAADSDLHYEIINISGGAPVALGTLIDTLEQVLARPITREYLPPQPGDMERTDADISKAERLLGWTPRVDLTTGLQRAAAWQLGSVASTP